MAGKFTLLTALTVAAATTLLSGCLATTPVLGGSTGNAVSGSAAGANAANQNAALESYESTLGTLSVFEDRTLPWWGTYIRHHPDLGSTMPVIRLLIQQSGCFVVVERGAAMDAVNKERALMNSGELRDNSSFEKGQMVAADYTMSPSVQFSETGTGGVGGAIAGRLLGSVGTALAGGLKKMKRQLPCC